MAALTPWPATTLRASCSLPGSTATASLAPSQAVLRRRDAPPPTPGTARQEFSSSASRLALPLQGPTAAPGAMAQRNRRSIVARHEQSPGGVDPPSSAQMSRRAVSTGLPALCLSLTAAHALGVPASLAAEGQFTDMPALRGKDYGKSKMKYPDYIETPTGLQYKDLKEGSGPSPAEGDLLVIDWDGFTIGYYGRIFEARNKAKGGSFEGNEKDFFRFRLGAGEVIPAFEEALATMQVGAIRRIIVPPELGYPDNDFNKKGPRPITFSGQRALDFVLKNQGLIDKTLLFDIELLRIIPA